MRNRTVPIDRLRHLAAERWWAIERKRSDPARIRHYLRTHAIRKLQIGAGPHPLPGWLNTDLLPDLYPEQRDAMVRLDASHLFPLPDQSFDYVASEHQIEHLPVTDATSMLRECFRVLRPQGRLRIATPDLSSMLSLYFDDPLDEAQLHYVEWVMQRFWPDVTSSRPQPFVVNQMFHAYGHQFIYDRATLASLLGDAGFIDISEWGAGESSDPELRGVESHGQSLGDEAVNRFETMVLEAVRSPDG